MTSCSEAFQTIQACAVLIVGVGGSMPAHGMGTACFIGMAEGIEYAITIHNCLLCHGEDGYNLLSVSQLLREPLNAVVFRSGDSYLEIQGTTKFELRENEGLYEMRVAPLYHDDVRTKLPSRIQLTLENDVRLWGKNEDVLAPMEMRSPTKLGKWRSKMLWISRTMAPMQSISHEYDTDLTEFCSSYFVPPSQSPARRSYKISDVEDMAALSLRFMGLGTDRLIPV